MVSYEAYLTLILTGHRCIDYSFVLKNSSVIIDAKNAMDQIKARDNIEVL